MKKLFVIVGMTLVGLSLPGFAQAETLNSKLTDMMASVAGSSEDTSQPQEVAGAPADEAEKQALQAEAQDAVNQALENARSEQQK